MKIIKPSWEIINEPDWAQALREMEAAARTCYKSGDKITEGSAEKLVRTLLKRKHEAMIEFGPSLTVRFICDRGVSHEMVRHRLCSFAQESTRYVKYDGEMEFILPPWVDPACLGLCTDYTYPTGPSSDGLWDADSIWMNECKRSEEAYQRLIQVEGWQPQQARTVLPNSLKTEIVVKTNIRDWRHIFHLRCDKTAHPQMRELMIPLYDYLNEQCPLLFDNVEFDR